MTTIDLYHEVHGKGEPLILLHGGLATIDMLFADLIPPLAKTRQVIAVELQAHGHTPDADRPMTYEAMADDVAALIRRLGLAQVDIFGFSLGGGVALQMTIRHPQLVRKLMVMSAPFAYRGWYPEVREGMASVSAEAAPMMLDTPMYKFYAAVAPDVNGWTALCDKTGTLLRQDYDWSADVAKIAAPVLLIVGDADSITLPHMVEFFGLLGGGLHDGFALGRPASQLAILSGADHINITSMTDPLLAALLPFLEEYIPIV